METKLINGNISIDDRGSVSFVNDFMFENVKRFYQVQNHNINYIRAWHGHYKEGKYVYVASGTALIGVVKLDSIESIPSKFIISSRKPQILWIPPGHANGFKNLEENTIIQFFSTTTLQESVNDDLRFEYNKWDIWGENYR